MTNGCHHEWWVYSTALTEGWIMLVCDKTGQTGTVRDPSKEEWAEAFHAPSEPYRWHDEARVIVDEQAPEMSLKSLQAEVLLKLVGKAEFEKRGDPAVLFAPEGLTLANIEAPADAAVVQERRNLAEAIKEHVAAKRKERPIVFSGPMVRAILSGRKTQTRRVVKPQPTRLEWFEHQKGWLGSFRDDAGSQANPHRMVPCPYGEPGDRLWVRETFSTDAISMYPCPRAWYRATDFNDRSDLNDWHVCPKESRGRWADCLACWEEREGRKFRWRPSIFMRRELSRITLEIVSVRVERLQDISEADAVAEGVGGERDEYDMPKWPSATAAFDALWCSINGVESYKANPWVWVVEFKRI